MYVYKALEPCRIADPYHTSAFVESRIECSLLAIHFPIASLQRPCSVSAPSTRRFHPQFAQHKATGRSRSTKHFRIVIESLMSLRKTRLSALLLVELQQRMPPTFYLLFVLHLFDLPCDI
jgi:hypothetical protein